MSQVVEFLSTNHVPLTSIPSTAKRSKKKKKFTGKNHHAVNGLVE
jgi:hypothetical protein